MYKKQEAILDSESKYTFCFASTKSGKTYGLTIWILEQAMLGPGNRN